MLAAEFLAEFAGDAFLQFADQSRVVGHDAPFGTDGADLEGFGKVDRERSSGLGESVTFQDRHPEPPEVVTEAFAQRCSAGDGVAAVPAQSGADLAVHQRGEEFVLQPQGEAGAARVLGAGRTAASAAACRALSLSGVVPK